MKIKMKKFSIDQDFFERVYQLVRLIPEGRVTTYGIIARAVGSPSASRMVGLALNKSFTAKEYVPAHRVVNRNGFLTGKKFFGSNIMADLLKSEGINVENDRILNFKEVLWDPFIEITDL